MRVMVDRARVFCGEVLTPSANASALAAIARAHARAAFEQDDLQALHRLWNSDEAWTRTCAARVRLARDRTAIAAAVELAVSLGFRRASLAVDVPRLRVVSPGVHERPAAARAFYAHRDTWYACPRAQVNVWIPLFDVDERDSFAVFPGVFDRAVDNDSAEFTYGHFAAQGGFQSSELIASVYPRCLEALPRDVHRIRAVADQPIVFSAAHLHATTPNMTGRTRLSVDVRFVDLDDDARRAGAPDVDNRSRGSALVDYARPP
jgi:hypothetical protein